MRCGSKILTVMAVLAILIVGLKEATLMDPTTGIPTTTMYFGLTQ
jgi:hypothetical protein